MAGTRAPPRSLVFMPPSSNPVEDARRPENKRLVARYAMIHRPRDTLKPEPLPGTSTNPSQKKASRSTHPRSVSSAALPPTPESLESSVSPPSNHNGIADVQNNLRTTDNIRDYYNPPLEEEDLQAHTQYHSRSTEGRIFDKKQRHQAARSQAYRHRIQGLGVSVPDQIDEDDGDTYSAVGRRDSHSTALVTTEKLLTPLPNVKDPFDCLPIKNNPHTQELLYLYLNAHLLSPAFTQGNPEVSLRIQKYRRHTWFPIILESKATLNALVAYIESTPDLPVKARNSDFLISHVQCAYEGMRYALSNPKTETDDSICVAVVLLMLTAQRLGDHATYRAHATGLMHLLAARSKALRASPRLRDLEAQKWQDLHLKINGPPNPDPCKYCLDAHLRPDRSSSPESPETLPPEVPHESSENSVGPASPQVDPKLLSQARGSGFYDVISRGLIAENMTSFVDQILIWISLAEQARRDRLSAAAAATHAWVDERPGRLPPLDTACQYAVRICLYLSSWLEGGHSCSIVRRMTMAVFLSLRSSTLDIGYLLDVCPELLLWISFVIGPFAEDDFTRQWLMCLMVRARHAISPTWTWDFEQLLEHVSSLFIWTSTMTPGARRFVNDNSWDFGTAVVWMEEPF